jgi:hypothetical protein
VGWREVLLGNGLWFGFAAAAGMGMSGRMDGIGNGYRGSFSVLGGVGIMRHRSAVDWAFFWGCGSQSDGIDLIVLLGFGILNLSVN